MVLSRLGSKTAKNTLKYFSPDQQKDIVYRMATAGNIHEDILNQVAKSVQEKLKVFDSQEGASTGGSEKLAEILNLVKSKTGKDILSDIEKRDTNLASRVKNKMFTFADIPNLEDKSLRKALFGIENEIIALALKDESNEMKQKFLSNVSENRKRILLADFRSLGPQKRSVIQEAKDKIISVLRKLEEKGELFFKDSDKSDEWV